jgi:hypothetical protein
MPYRTHVGGVVCWLACLGATTLLVAQNGGRDDLAGSPLARPPVVGAPFSADATTIVKQTLSDGTRVDRTAFARYYRDSAGRVRVEQRIPTAGDPSSPASATLIMLATEPSEPRVYTIEPLTRTFYTSPRDNAALVFNGRHTFAFGAAPNHFLLFHPEDWRTSGFDRPVTYSSRELALGTRVIAGVESVGRRVTLTVPPGENGNIESIEIVGDQWDSPELRVLLYSRYSNPLTGMFEYRLTNIRRAEPSPELFDLPPDYVERTTSNADPAMIVDFWPRTVRARTMGAAQWTR